MKILVRLIVLLLVVAGCRTSNDGGLDGPSDAPGEAKRILIFTGVDYPGKQWRETTRFLGNAIGRDERLSVSVTEVPEDLADSDLSRYDAIVLHFMAWDAPDPDPGPEARANLEAFVRAGGGLVLVHFACGAFQQWSRFPLLAGRVWKPGIRGPDPRGVLSVEISDVEHPITRGMTAFATSDVLHASLAGKTPIDVLATARSNVDGEDYPVAFVLTYGRGRVFHCLLGHDAQALDCPPVTELFRRGTAWTAGLNPVAEVR